MSLFIPDVSEFQGIIDWSIFGASAVIVRINYGDVKVDAQADRNIEGARQRCRWRGWYCYLIGADNPVVQAGVFTRVLLAHGGLWPAEAIIVDDEEGTGDQSSRVNAFLDQCDSVLRQANPAGQDWWYSGLNFSIAHNLQAARGHRWIAAYQNTEPTVSHDLWQYTDAALVAGVNGPVDASIFHGTIDDLITLTGGTPPVTNRRRSMVVSHKRSDGSYTDVFSLINTTAVHYAVDSGGNVVVKDILPGTWSDITEAGQDQNGTVFMRGHGTDAAMSLWQCTYTGTWVLSVL